MKGQISLKLPIGSRNRPQAFKLGRKGLSWLLLASLLGCTAEFDSINPFDRKTPSSEQATGTIIGRVILEGFESADHTDVTITGLNLHNQAIQAVSATVEADGFFRVDGLPPGRYRVDYDAPFYLPAFRDDIDLDFASKRRLEPQPLERRRVHLQGRVRLADYEGRASNVSAGVRIELATPTGLARLRGELQAGESALPEYLLTATDTHGYFVIADVPVGRSYTLVAHHPTHVPWSVQIDVPEVESNLVDLVEHYGIDPVLALTQARVLLNEGRGYTHRPAVRVAVRDVESDFVGIIVEEIRDDPGQSSPGCGPSQIYGQEQTDHCVVTPIGRIVPLKGCHEVSLAAEFEDADQPCEQVATGRHTLRVTLVDSMGHMTVLDDESIEFDDRPIEPEYIQLIPRDPTRWGDEHHWLYSRDFDPESGGILKLGVEAHDGESPRASFTGCLRAVETRSLVRPCSSPADHEVLRPEARVVLQSVDDASPMGHVFRLHVAVGDGAQNITSFDHHICADSRVPPAPSWWLTRKASTEDVALPLARPQVAEQDDLPHFVTPDPVVYFTFAPIPNDDNPCAQVPVEPPARGRDLAFIHIQDTVDEESIFTIRVPAQGPVQPIRWELQPGDRENRIFLTFEDMAGNRVRQEVSVVLDTEPPVAPRLQPRQPPNGILSLLTDPWTASSRFQNGIYWTANDDMLEFIATTGDPRDDREPGSRLLLWSSDWDAPLDVSDAFHARSIDGIISVRWPTPLPHEPVEVWAEFRDLAGNPSWTEPVVVQVDQDPPMASVDLFDGRRHEGLTFVRTADIRLDIEVEDESHPTEIRTSFATSRLSFSCHGARGFFDFLLSPALCALMGGEIRPECGPAPAPELSHSSPYAARSPFTIAGNDGRLCITPHIWDLVGNLTILDPLHVILDRLPPPPPVVRHSSWSNHEQALSLRVEQGDEVLTYRVVFQWEVGDRRSSWSEVVHLRDLPGFGECERSNACGEVQGGDMDLRLFMPDIGERFTPTRVHVTAFDLAGNQGDPTVLSCLSVSGRVVCQ